MPNQNPYKNNINYNDNYIIQKNNIYHGKSSSYSGIPNKNGYWDEDSLTISSFFSLTILSTGKSIFILFKKKYFTMSSFNCFERWYFIYHIF